MPGAGSKSNGKVMGKGGGRVVSLGPEGSSRLEKAVMADAYVKLAQNLRPYSRFQVQLLMGAPAPQNLTLQITDNRTVLLYAVGLVLVKFLNHSTIGH